MLKSKFDIQDLTRSTSDIARLVPAEELFSWLTRSVGVPAGWVGLASRAGMDAILLLAGQPCEAQDLLDMLFVRSSAIECTVQHPSLESTDGFFCRGQIRVSIRVLTESGELSAFRKALVGSTGQVTATGLTRYLEAPLQRVLADLAGRHPAADFVTGLDPSEVRQAIETRVGPVCLTAGLAIDGPAGVAFESPAWQEHRRQHAQIEQRRQHTEARAQIQEAVDAAQRQHLDHLLTVIKNLSLAGDGQKLSLPDLLTGFSDAQRGQLYAALWHLRSTQATRLVAAVSGYEVLLFEPTALQKPARRLRLPETLGALRSISVRAESGRSLLLIGAARGIHLLDLESGEPLHVLEASTDPTRPVQGGFNAAAMTDTHVFGTHTELGVMAWNIPESGATGAPTTAAIALLPHLTRGATAVRCARISEGQLWFSADTSLWATPLDRLEAQPTLYRGGSSPISAICFDSQTVYIGDASGRIVAFEVGQSDSERMVRSPTGQPIESLHVVDTCGVSRLIVADRGTGLTAMVMGDQYTRRYEGGSAIVRRAAAAPDLFVAMNDGRDRLLAWDPRRADAPLASIVIPHLTGSTMQDIALIPA